MGNLMIRRFAAVLAALSLFGLGAATAGAGDIVRAGLAPVAPPVQADAGPQMSLWPQTAGNTTSFCGACSDSDHDACGGQSNGWSCCSDGCSDGKMQCWNVVSCDKVAGLGDFRPEPAAAVPVIVAQSNDCANWYSNIEAQLSSYNSQCSGELSQSQYDYCVAWQRQINDEISSYNNRCG